MLLTDEFNTLGHQTLVELCMLEHGLRDEPLHPSSPSLNLSVEPSQPPSDVVMADDDLAPTSSAPLASEADKNSSSPPEASLSSTLPSSLPTVASLPPASTTTEPVTDTEIEVDDRVSNNNIDGHKSPSFDPSIEYEFPLDYFPADFYPPPTADQLAQAAHEIALFKLARAKFESEESTDPFAWVRKEYSFRVSSLSASWKRENAEREERGELDQPMSEILQTAMKQGEEMELDVDGDGEGEEEVGDVGAGEGKGGGRRSKRKTKGKRPELLKTGRGGGGGGKGSTARGRAKGRK